MKKYYIIAVSFLCCSMAYAEVPRSDIPRIDPGRIEQQIAVPLTKAKKPKIVPKIEKEKPPTQLNKEVKFKLKKVIIKGATVQLPWGGLTPLYSNYLNHEVTLEDLHKIADDITAKYRERGYILCQAIVPAQHIHHGVVIIQVIEGYIDQVTVQGNVNSWTKRVIQSYGDHIKQSRPLTMDVLERYVLLADDLTGVQVQTVLTPSKTKEGAADLTFVVTEQRFEFMSDFNNHGTRYIGPQQASVTPQINGVFYNADQLGGRWVGTPNNDTLRFLQVFYRAPIGSEGFRFDGSLDYTRTRPGFTLASMHLYGESKVGKFGFTYSWVRTRRFNTSLYANFKWLDSKTDYPSAVVYEDHIRALYFGANVNLADVWRGVNDLNLEYGRGLRAFGSSSHDPRYPLSRSNGRSDFRKADFTLSRLQVIDNRISGLVAATGQYAWTPLLSSEEFGFGGTEFGRGYDPSEIVGDKGGAAKGELRFNTFPPYFWIKYVQYYVFYDVGFVINIGDNNDQPRRQTAASTGLGLRTHLLKYIDMDLQIDRPLTYPVQTMVNSGHNGNGWRGFFLIRATF